MAAVVLLVRIIVCIGGCAFLGYIMGALFPIFSDPLTQNLCQPGSPCRQQSAQAYAVGGALVGVVLALIGHLLSKQKELSEAIRIRAQAPPSPAVVLPPAPLDDGTNWYVLYHGKPRGPLTRPQLTAEIRAGQLTEDTRLNKAGTDEWLTLREVVERGE